jgi:hypothetical protein
MGIKNQTNTRVFSDSSLCQETSTKNAVQELHLRTQPHQIPTEWRGQEASVIVGRLFVGIWQVSLQGPVVQGEGEMGIRLAQAVASLPIIAFCATDYIVPLFFFGYTVPCRIFCCSKKAFVTYCCTAPVP